jgi:2'-5' RNA ligase
MTDAASPEPRWRCFVAAPIGEELRAELAVAVAALRRAEPETDAAFRWTEPEGWHVTLAFLGATDADQVPSIVEALRAETADVGSFEVSTGGMGAFPSARRARVLWYRVLDEQRRLRLLATGVRDALGLDAGSPFRAHLTLARARAREGVRLGEELMDAAMPGGRIVVDRVVLYRSHLGRGPARYEKLADLPLLAGLATARANVASPA